MPWNGSAPSQTFGRTDGTRSGSQVWQQADAASVDIVAPDHDTHDQDIADAISACLKKDGGNAATSNIPMGGFGFTNVAAATARTMFARFSDLQDGKGIYIPTVGGTANTITLTSSPIVITAYAAGQTFRFIAAATNTGAVTVNVDGVGAKNVLAGGSALSAGMIATGNMVTISYDGTQFQLQAESPAVIPVGIIMAWPIATVPTGWLECNGQAVSRTTYSALFGVISDDYGAGDGSTTFNVPNYAGYFLRGHDDGDGTDPDAASRTDRGDGTTGDNVGTKQTGATASHTHTGTVDSDGSHTHFIANTDDIGAGSTALSASNRLVTHANQGGDERFRLAGSATASTIGLTSSNGAHTHTFTSGATGGNETRPKNIYVKFIILALPSAAFSLGFSAPGGISAAGGFSITPRNIHTGDNPATAAADGTNLTIVATELYVAEVFIPANCTVTGVAVFWGDATEGNAKVMLFNSAGTRVAISASTDVSGHSTDAYTRIAFSSAYSAVGPATYYVGVICDSTSNRLNTHVVGNFGAGKITGLVYGTEAGYATITPPTTFTTGLGPIASLY